MSVILKAFIYGINAAGQNGANGRVMGFPAQHVLIRPFVADGTNNGVYSGVTVKSIIQLINNGPTVNQPQYYSDATPDALITAANA